MQLIGYIDDIHIMGRMKRAVSEVLEGLRETAKEIGHNIRDEKQKQWYKIREKEE